MKTKETEIINKRDDINSRTLQILEIRKEELQCEN